MSTTLSISRTYLLASKVKSRLTKEAVKTDVDLHRLVCQANLLDSLIEDLNTRCSKVSGRSRATISFDSIATTRSIDVAGSSGRRDVNTRSRMDRFFQVDQAERESEEEIIVGKEQQVDSDEDEDDYDYDYDYDNDNEMTSDSDSDTDDSSSDSDSDSDSDEEYEGGSKLELQRMPSHSEGKSKKKDFTVSFTSDDNDDLSTENSTLEVRTQTVLVESSDDEEDNDEEDVSNMRHLLYRHHPIMEYGDNRSDLLHSHHNMGTVAC
ncbi:DEKNAAC101455 [Brettanomyces naardenensis]|uniref:DEKNAAC101455 n=1 Tax=Brettanomyces naardenensis TaxID=13370 RepID=A0A448YHZ9_BRENA|nr:DEKNAAC101455 [Brettanomyces naardenensis]